MSDDVTKVVTWLFEAFNEGDLERAATTVSNDFELVDVAAGQTFRGPDGCRQWLEIFRTALPDARTEIVNLFTDGVRVASEHIGRGTHTGPFVTPAGAIPATGRPVELRIGEIYEVRDDNIAKLYAYYNRATLMRQLGLLPPQRKRRGAGDDRLMGASIKARRAVRRT